MICTKTYLNPTTGCDEDLGPLMQVILASNTFQFNTQALAQELANWQSGIYSKNIYVLPVISAVELMNTDEIYDETPYRKMPVASGKMGWKVTFDAGIDLNTKLQSFSSNGDLSVFLAFKSGAIIGYKPLGGTSIKPLATSFVNAENYKFNDFAKVGGTTVAIELKDERQFNNWPAVIIPELATTPWDYSQLESLKSVVLEIVTATATKITFKAYLQHVANDAGVKIPLQGAVAGDFALTTTAGVAQTISTLTATAGVAGQYEATGTGLVSGFLAMKAPSLATTKGYEGVTPVTVTIP